jgi:mRNA-degrading endonuclease RelE of RelBE toxin-antitoxin system
MGIEVKYTPGFEKELKQLAKKYHSIYKDVAGLIDLLEENP